MTKELKAFLYYFLIFFLVFQVIRWAFLSVLPDVSPLYSVALTGAVTAILVPQFKSIETEGKGKRIKVKWLFFKKPLFIR